nr:transglycosylase SLT domain-containing protein [Methylomarinum sp. Ch1-1]MDP4520939.1 transglycosylase SLT domain-containing protein [Methylomarinum sp. Ch1-1]
MLVAAKLAQHWQWDQVAIFTIAKAKYWDDVDLRFPVKYLDQVKVNARLHELDPAIVFGLIRRESAFNEKARSPVGARGLMQIMPRTGRQIARDLKEQWRSAQSLFNPEVNVKYGTYYYKKLLQQFNGHYALAAAAYNAGPHRVEGWLPDENAVAADIWIETIPFKETRAYVSAVLTYALIYQQRMQRNMLKIKDFMRDILPN